MAETEQLKKDLAESDYALTVAELRRKMAWGASGELWFKEPNQSDHDVDLMSCTTVVLELRLNTCRGANGVGSRIIRLYFTEPEDLAGGMVILLLAWKPDGKAGLLEQTAQALAAQKRADEHCARG